MSSDKLFEKLKEVNKPDEFVMFKLEFKNKVVHEKKIIIPEYGQDVLSSGEVSLYYFFKDMANLLEAKILEAHKKMIENKNNNEKKI
jgi:hypothetical protein